MSERGTASQPTLAEPIVDPRDPALLALATLRPVRVWADIARCFAVIAIAWAMLARVEADWIVAVPCFLLIGTQQYALALIAHDGRHGRLFHGRRLNDVVTRFVIGAPLLHDAHYAAETTLHRAHHRLLGTAADPERHLYSATDKATRARFLFYLTGLPSVPLVLRKLRQQTRGGGSGEPWRDRAIHAWSPIVVAQLLVVAVASAAGAWWYYLLFWLGPIYVCVFVPKKIRVWCEHGHPILPDEVSDSRRLITFVPNRIERWLLAPSNMHFHAEHHLWPFVPYYNLPALHRLVRGHPAIEVRRSYVRHLRAYFRALPLPGAPSC